MASGFGIAPRKVGGQWVTRNGRVLSQAGQAYWDRLHQQGRTDGRGHIIAPTSSATQASPRAKKPTQPTVNVTVPGGLRIGNRPVTTPEQERQQRIYKASQQATRQSKADVQRMTDARFAGAIPAAQRANKTINPTVGRILTSVSPLTAVIQTGKELQRHNILGAGAASLGIVPFGPGKLFKGAEEAIKAGQVAKAGEVLPAVSSEAQKAAEAFAGSGSVYKSQRALQSAEKGQRVAGMASARAAVGGGQAGHYAAKSQLKGAYTKVPFNDLKSLDQQTINRLHDEIAAQPHLGEFDKINLSDAIDRAKQGIVPRPFEVELMHRAFGPQAAQEFANTGTRFSEMVANVANIPRSIMASGDLSAPFRQGLMAFAMHPTLAARHLPKMVRDFASEKHYQAGLGAIHADPEYANSLKAGVSYTELGQGVRGREEQFGSKAAETLTGVGALVGKGKGSGSLVRMSGRAYTGFLDRVRLELYKSLKAEAQGAGHDLRRVSHGTTLDQDIATLTNWATGRGTFRSRKIEAAAPLLNSFLFSPRLFKSRLDAVNPNFYRTLDPFARKKAAGSLVKLVATGSAVLALAKYIGGAHVEVDPRSSDWGKIRFGKTRYDLWGGYQQIARAIAQEITQTTKSSTTGQVQHVKHPFDPLLNLMKGKASPPVSLVQDIQAGKMFGNQPVTLKNEAAAKLDPILWQDISDAIHTGSWQNAAATAGLGSLGVGTQTYSSQQFGPQSNPNYHPPHRHPQTGRFVTSKKDPSLPSWAPNNRKPPPRVKSRDPNLPSWAR